MPPHSDQSFREEPALLDGFVESGFEGVRDAFMLNLSSIDVGANFALWINGQLKIDLWGGYADNARTRRVDQESLFNLFSATKGATATCVALLVDRNVLSYETPVTTYWPEFAAHGKSTVTVGQMLSHQAGLCGTREPVTIEDYYEHTRIAAQLAAQEPFFKPASAWGYHALSFGTLIDELVRRVDGRTLSQLFADELAGPLELDMHYGLDANDDPRQVQTIAPMGAQLSGNPPPNPAAFHAAYENPPLDPNWPNTRPWRANGLAGVGGSANARSLARLYDVLANHGKWNGQKVFRDATLVQASRERIAGADQVSGVFKRYAAGFQLNMNGSMGPTGESFGHDGWGGTMGFADPKRGIACAYLANQMAIPSPGTLDARLARLLQAVYACAS